MSEENLYTNLTSIFSAVHSQRARLAVLMHVYVCSWSLSFQVGGSLIDRTSSNTIIKFLNVNEMNDEIVI